MPAMAPSLILLVSLSLALLPSSLACSLAPGACNASSCAALANMKSATTLPAQYSVPSFYGATNMSPDKKLGWWAGLANSNAVTNNTKGGAYINWELFPYIGVKTEAGFLISYHSIPNITDCCTKCAQTADCMMFQFFSNGNNLSALYSARGYQECSVWPEGFKVGYNCYLLSGGSVNESATTNTFANGKSILSPWTPWHSQQINATWRMYPASFVGGYCNPDSGVTGDPHFVGAKGTRFEFNGEVDKAFALISDQRLQVNVRMDGYLDSRTSGAAKIKDGKAVRTWIRDVGLTWRDADNSVHTMVLKARSGQDADIHDGFLAALVVDGEELVVPAFGAEITRGALKLSRVGVRKQWVFDVETYHLSMDGLLSVKLELRPAHPLLRTDDDAYVHFGLFIESLEASDKVHGILGQTFRATSDRVIRALEYQLLSKLIRGPISADTDVGKGFLDGGAEDYEVSDVLSTQFKFSAFS